MLQWISLRVADLELTAVTTTVGIAPCHHTSLSQNGSESRVRGMAFLNAPELIFDGSAVTTTAPCYNPVSSNTPQSKSSCGSRTKLPMFFRASAGSRKRRKAQPSEILRRDRCGHFRRQQCRNARNAGHIEAASCRRSGFLVPRREVVWVQFCIPGISLIFPFSGDILCVCLYIYIYILYYIWWFPKLWWYPQIIHFRLDFSTLNHPKLAWGSHICRNPPWSRWDEKRWNIRCVHQKNFWKWKIRENRYLSLEFYPNIDIYLGSSEIYPMSDKLGSLYADFTWITTIH